MKLFFKLYAIIALLIIGVGAEALAATPPTIQSRYQAFSQITSTSAKLAWINGNGAKRVVVATTNGGINWATVAANLNTSAEYTDVNGNLSTAPQVGATGAYVVDVLSGTFRVTNLSNLSANSTYYIHVFEYNVGGSPYIAYNSNSSVINPANFTTLMLAPVLANATNITDDAADFSWTDPNNPDAASYNMDIATDAQFNNLVLSQFNTTGFGLTVINFDPNTVYYVRLYAVNGPNTSAASNVITFKTLLAPPVITANGPITFCGSGSVDLSYTPVNGLTYQWYKDAAPIQGATTTPYTATEAGAYYVVATDNLNNTGTSNTITITINPLPAVAVANGSTICANNTATITPTAVAGIGFRYYDAATAGNLLFTGASYTTPVLNLTTTYYVEAYNTTTMCAAATRTPVVITVNPLPANALVNGATICAGNTTTLTPTAVADVNFKFYDAPVAGTLLFTGAAYTTPVLNANATYYVEACNTVTGCVAAARTAVTVTVNPLPANAVAAGSTICANSTATITPNVVAGVGFRYYDALTAGTLLGTGASFTTPVLNATTTYYVEAYNTTTMCIAAARTAVTITVNPLPANAVVNGATICANNTATLTPTAVAGVSFRFYDAATAGTLLFTGAAYTTPELNANATYYVEAYNTTTMCIAAARTAVTVTVNPLPANALVNGTTICAGNTATLTPTAVADINFRFYDAPAAGTLLFTGAAYTTPVLNANTTYYVEAYNTVTGCVAAARTAVTVTVNPLAVVNTHPLSQLVNTGDNVTFTVVAANASSYQWQESQDNGQTWNDINLATGTSYTITNVPASITGYQYRVVVTNNCNTVNSDPAVLTVIIGEPTTQATNINWNYWSRTEINFSWTRGNGTNVLVVAKQGTNGIVAPVDGMTYTANTVFGAGSNLGAGSYVVYDGPGTSVSVTGLTRNTDYVFQVFEYNGTGLSTNYNPNAGLNNPRTRKTSIKEGFNVNEELTHNFNGNFAVSEVSPNPVSSNFNFSISALDAQEASVELYSVTGELVYSRTLNLVAGENPVNVQLVSAGNFAAGVYSLRIRSGADFIDKKVVIVP